MSSLEELNEARTLLSLRQEALFNAQKIRADAINAVEKCMAKTCSAQVAYDTALRQCIRDGVTDRDGIEL